MTLIELLVAIAIVGILGALLLPAVQHARASARQLICKNQLRQLGLALHEYHGTHSCFPAGSYVMGPSFPMQTGWGWGAMLLPAVEQRALYDAIDFRQGTAVGGNLALIATPVSLWRCPSDVAPDRINAVPLNRPAFNLASGNFCGSEGILSAMSCVRLAAVTDGASQTLMLGERLVQSGEDGSLAFTSAWCGQAAFVDGYEYRSVPHLEASRSTPINVSVTNPFCFGSRHTGGANFAMADGSARFFSESMDSRVFESLGTANGGEVVQVP